MARPTPTIGYRQLLKTVSMMVPLILSLTGGTIGDGMFYINEYEFHLRLMSQEVEIKIPEETYELLKKNHYCPVKAVQTALFALKPSDNPHKLE